MSGTLPDLRKLRQEIDGLVRSAAVEAVDAEHGYTLEFAGSPSAHSAEYDEHEEWLRGELGLHWDATALRDKAAR